MKLKSIFTKSIATVALSAAGIAVINNANSNDAQAAIVENDISVYTVTKNTTVYNDYKKDKKATGQILAANSSWKVIKTAKDKNGNKWYDLGKDQWIKAEKVVQEAASQAPTTNTQNSDQNTSSSYTSNASGSEAEAKAWIANRESGGSYSASNGQYVGKYQLSASYLGGDYSAANQERAADNYVKSRYGSWTAAKSFWQANGWY